MLHGGSKVVAKKGILGVISKGDICEIADVNDNVVSFTFGENFTGKGVMSVNEFNECFEVIENHDIPNVRVSEDRIKEIIENSVFDINTVFDKCTVVSCRLPNGFVITESSACVSPENYDLDTGVQICMNRIMDKVWELEAYKLQQELFEEYGSPYPCSECPCDGDCDECCCDEEDDCLDTDLDCDDCDDYDCPYNTNRPITH